MKYNNILLYVLLIAFLPLTSCDNDSILSEVPKGFLSPENSFINKEGFVSATANLYRLSRGLQTSELLSGEGDKAITSIYCSGTDMGWYWDKKLFFGDYSLINSSNAVAIDYWKILYSIIKDANVILTRLDASPLTEPDKQFIAAEARFFRAYAYRFLVYFYGDVPKITEEIKTPKIDFVRSPKSEIIAFMIEDLEFATQYLPEINPGDGHLSKAAADHLLTETYITAGDYDNAVAAASRVIDNGQYKLMTERFGTYATKPGDVFWDLFRLSNQNRTSGNTESILVWQMEFDLPGGQAQYRIERAWGPWLEKLVDSQNKKAILPADSLGRSIGFIRPSAYLETMIWESDFNNDIRNSKYNMQRQFYNNNPASPDFMKVIIPKAADIARNHFVWLKKASSPHGHPQGYDVNGNLYTDIYAIRLAETYLLRAEAYLKKGDQVSAAADINVLRQRAKANPVEPGNVDIDYILDERARELAGEEPRRLTLSRLELLYDRVMRYNPVSSPSIKPFHNLLPIPQTIIDANAAVEFPQNEGYF